MTITVSELYIHPVKGLKRIPLQSMKIDSIGPVDDRRWMIIDSENKFVSQRTHPILSLIRVALDQNKLCLQIPDQSEISISLAHSVSPEIQATIWRDTCRVVEVSVEASQALSQFLGVDCRLVRMAENKSRFVDQQYTLSQEAREVSFADGFPFLLTTQESLDDLNNRLESPIKMNRFRPNIVIQGTSALAEDHWKTVRIGEVVFDLVKPCTRCTVTTVDQDTGERGKEPLKTLAKYRNTEKGIVFGQNAIHRSTGIIHIGDELVVLE